MALASNQESPSTYFCKKFCYATVKHAAIFLFCHTTNIPSDIMGEHNKVGGITFKAAHIPGELKLMTTFLNLKRFKSFCSLDEHVQLLASNESNLNSNSISKCRENAEFFYDKKKVTQKEIKMERA